MGPSYVHSKGSSLLLALPSSLCLFLPTPSPSFHSPISQTYKTFIECQAPFQDWEWSDAQEFLALCGLHSSECCVSYRQERLCLAQAWRRVGTYTYLLNKQLNAQSA